MKKTIRIKDSNGKVVKEGEVKTRNLEHFQTQLMYRSKKVESKKVYNRNKLERVVW